MGFVWVISFLILCPVDVLIRWLFWFLVCILMDLKISLLVFIAMPSKPQAPTNTTTLEIGFGTK